ncbi:MAG: hypothetical protein V3R84_03670 [Acidimicrobiia bacterium]
MTETSESLGPHDAKPKTPWWFERIVGALASALIGYGLIGMLLAQLGWFRIGPVMALGTALSYTIFAQLFAPGPGPRAPSIGRRNPTCVGGDCHRHLLSRLQLGGGR